MTDNKHECFFYQQARGLYESSAAAEQKDLNILIRFTPLPLCFTEISKICMKTEDSKPYFTTLYQPV